jgi:hypothetical protein
MTKKMMFEQDTRIKKSAMQSTHMQLTEAMQETTLREKSHWKFGKLIPNGKPLPR